MPLRLSLPSEEWDYPLLRLAKLILATLSTKRPLTLCTKAVDSLLRLLRSLATTIPQQLSHHSSDYFMTLAALTANRKDIDSEILRETVASSLEPVVPGVDAMYEGFASEFLTIPELPTVFGDLAVVARSVNYEHLTTAIDKLLHSSDGGGLLNFKRRESLLWLLAYFIYFRRQTLAKRSQLNDSPDVVYVNIVSKLVSFLADDIGNGIDTSVISSSIASDRSLQIQQFTKLLPAFIRNEILSLINQGNVSSLLANIDVTESPRDAAVGFSSEASALASYALTLLSAFPRRGDEIRMWLYRGSTSRQTHVAQGSRVLPAIKYFYQAASTTKVFELISQDPNEAVHTLKPDQPRSSTLHAKPLSGAENRDQEWRVILLFLELYTFVLKVMDDEEFLSGTVDSNPGWSWTRQSALPLEQVKVLTVFLKNLAFSMYWNASVIAGIETAEAKTSLADYFGGGRTAQSERVQTEAPPKLADLSIAGVNGMSLAYVKGMVTGVLRMVYERE